MRTLITCLPNRRRRSLAGWFGIVAMMLPILAPVAQGIPIAAADDEFQSPFYMVLCKAMQEDPTGPSPDQDPGVPDCPVCLGFSFTKHVLLTSLLEIPALPFCAPGFIIEVGNETVQGRTVSRSHARAPPITV